MFRCSALVLVLTVFWPTWAWAKVAASLNRSSVHLGETLELRIKVESDNGQHDPNLLGLVDDFEILGSHALSGGGIQLGGGGFRVSNHLTWVVQLKPLRQGDLLIKPIAVGAERSEPLRLQVKPPRQAGGHKTSMSLEVEVQPAPHYVQAQLMYSVRLLLPRNSDLLDWDILEPELPNVPMQRLQDVTYQSQNGQQALQVIERRWLLFPGTSGALHIPAPVFQGRVPGEPMRFGSIGSIRRGQLVQLEGKPVTVQVQSIPATYPAQAAWLPALNVQLEEQWALPKEGWQVGQPVQRTLRLRAQGLRKQQLPEIETTKLAGMRLFSEPAERKHGLASQGLSSQLVQKIAYQPTKGGQFKVPALKLPWWDVRKDQLRWVELPARMVSVPIPAGASQPAEALLGPDSMTESAVPVAERQGATIADYVPWLIAAVALLGWLLTALLLWRRGSASAEAHSQQTDPQQELSKQQQLKALQHACRDQNAVAAARAVVLYARSWDCPANSVLGLHGYLNVDEGAQRLLSLDAAVYKATGSAKAWTGMNDLASWLPTAMRHWHVGQAATPANAGLAPLFPYSIKP